MKVLNIIPRYAPAIGGSETWCRDLCRFLARQGIITKVATINIYNVAEAFDPNFLGEDFIKLGNEDFDEGVFIKRYTLWKPWSNLLSAKIIRFLLHILKLNKTQIGDIFATSPNSLQMYRDLPKQIKDVDVVVLHTLPYFNNVIGFVWAKLYRKKIIMVPYFHIGHIHYERDIFYRMMNYSEAVITLSTLEKEYLIRKKVNPQKIFALGCAVDKDMAINEIAFANFKKELFTRYCISEFSKKIIFVGRKEIYKGIFLLIGAIKKLSQEVDMELVLILVGPDTPDFTKAYADYESADKLRIINVGTVNEEEKNYLIRISDLLVLPSAFESFGIVFLEAWMHSKPVVGTNSGVVPSILNDAGLCAEYGNIDDLKDKMKAVLCNIGLAEKLGRVGRQKIDQLYNKTTVYGKVLDIFNIIGVRRRKVLIVSQLFPPHSIGGSEVVAYEQAKILRDLNWRIKVFAGSIDDTVRRYRIKREGGKFDITRINLHHSDFWHDRYVNFDRTELRERFRRLIHNYTPDIVHFHNLYGLSLGMVDDCYKNNIPTVMTLHDYWGICPKNLLINEKGNVCRNKDGSCTECHLQLCSDDGRYILPYERNLKCSEYYRKVNLLISPSQYLAERFIERGIAREKFKVIKNGIDLSRFRGSTKKSGKKICLAFIGQIIWHKGLDIFLQAISLLNKDEITKLSILIVGPSDKTYLSYCKELARGFNFVKFMQSVSPHKIHAIYKIVDVLVMPSRWPENSPLVAQEALACGIPVVASDIGGIPEIIDNGVNGFLFSLNGPSTLVNKIRQIIRRPDIIHNMKLACIDKSAGNNLIHQVKIISDTYKNILDAL